MSERTADARVVIDYPAWVDRVVDWKARYPDDESRMRLAVTLSRENVLRGDGGPFGAAIFEADGGSLVSVGVNSVVRLGNSVLHAEVVAFMMAQRRLGSFTLSSPTLAEHVLVTSCEPCAMCLGATLWSGVRSVVYGAAREDASALGFDEGPVFEESYAYLEQRGIRITRGVLRDDARAVLELYRARSGKIYNA